ncbi:hypothetical protein GI582_24645 [Sulfitobacter sp. BDSS02]|nr:hypothetical protein [Sulfitobacter sp. BDSS02]MBR9852450.1 hypothetical protein [Paracoccaceae bacterium]
MTNSFVSTIAGSDSLGGAGIQAELETSFALGVDDPSASTPDTAQNTRGVFAVEAVTSAVLSARIPAVSDEIHPMSIKIGMLFSPEIAGADTAQVAQVAGVEAAMRRARPWLHDALRAADEWCISEGPIPIHHFREVRT